MHGSGGIWFQSPVASHAFVLCELETNKMDLKADLTEGCNQRNEFLKMISDVGQCCNIVRDRLIELVATTSKNVTDQQVVNDELKSQLNDLASELEFEKRQTNTLLSSFKTDCDKSTKQIERLKSEVIVNRQQNAKLTQQNELLETRLNRLELKMSTNKRQELLS